MQRAFLGASLIAIIVTATAFAQVQTDAAHVSAGQFGANTGGGTYSFPSFVGVGTTSPHALLEVSAANKVAFDATNSFFWIYNPTAPNSYCCANYDRLGLGYSSNVALITTQAAGTGTLRPIQIAPQGLSGLFLATNGLAGLGTASPNAAFEVAGHSKIALDTTNSFLWVSNPTAPNSYDGTNYDRLGLGYSSNVALITTQGAGTGTVRPMQIAPQGTGGITIGVTGNVGIGMLPGLANPQYALDVHGTINADEVISATYGQDVAEWVPANETLAAGTVVVLDPSTSNRVMPSHTAYDTTVAGVISGRPGVVLGSPGDRKAKVATLGRVRIRVDASKRPVRIGDLLVTSDKPGMAMVSEPAEIGGIKIHRPGTLIGKALEPLPRGEGEILALLSLQ